MPTAMRGRCNDDSGSGGASTAGRCCRACRRCATAGALGRSARVGYSILFGLATVAACLLQIHAASGPLMDKLPWIARHHGDEDGAAWYGQQAVYRISFGNFLFFAILAILLYRTKYKNNWRDRFIQHGNWGLKGLVWLVFNVWPFFLPGDLVWYGWMSRFGSGIFLIVQMLILLDVAHHLNDTWFQKGEKDVKFMYLLLGTTIGSYLGAGALAAVGFYFFRPNGQGSCTFNVSVLVWSLLLVLGFTILSVHPAATEGSLFPAGVISFYAMYLCFAALQSEPSDYKCNGATGEGAVSGSAVFLGMLITLLTVIYSAWRAGSKTHTGLARRKGNTSDICTPLLDEAEEGICTGLDGDGAGVQEVCVAEKRDKGIEEFERVNYSYSIFHMIFALASMYMAMLISGWANMDTKLVDVSWISVWVKMGAQFATALLYVWSLMAPSVLSERRNS